VTILFLELPIYYLFATGVYSDKPCLFVVMHLKGTHVYFPHKLLFSYKSLLEPLVGKIDLWEKWTCGEDRLVGIVTRLVGCTCGIVTVLVGS
jgi:hypothetical protein